MFAGFFAKITSGIWKYVALAAGVLAVLGKAVSMGASRQRADQQEQELENVQNRNEALEEVNSLSDDAVDHELREHIKARDKS